MKKILISLFILAAFTPFAARAQEYTLLEPLPCIEGTSASGQKCSGGVTQTISFNDYIGYVFKFSIALAVFLAIIMVIWGGIQYMTSEVPFLKIEGKNKIEGAVTGLVMVLASYLILATIDPRLVEIQTSVPAIEIKRASLTGFIDDVSSDIRKLSLETQSKTSALITEKNTLQQELERVKYAIENDRELSAQEIEELEIERATLEQKIRGVSVEISKSTATAIGQSSFARAYDLIKNTGGVENDASVRASNLASTRETLKSQYDTKIDSILKNSTKSEAEKLAETYDLYNQKDFYLAQIDEEVRLNEELKLHNSSYIGDESGTIIDRTPELKKKLSEYQANMTDPENVKAAGVTTAEYNLIMQARVNEINKVLGITNTAASSTPATQ